MRVVHSFSSYIFRLKVCNVYKDSDCLKVASFISGHHIGGLYAKEAVSEHNTAS
jgi:hypothetical protein